MSYSPRQPALMPSPELAPANACSPMDVRQARVMIVEDNRVNRFFLTAQLEKFGFGEIEIVESGAEAIAKLKAADMSSYNAIFMDCRMPPPDGCETTRLIRAQERRQGKNKFVPIIATTGNAVAGDREACLAAGMDDYIAKPVPPELLKKILQKWFAFPDDKGTSSVTAKKPAAAPIDFTRLDLVAQTIAEKHKVLVLFFHIAGELIELMAIVRTDAETSRWKNAAHNLEGSAGNMGMLALQDLGAQAEKATDFTQRSLILHQIRDELMRIKNYISQHNPALMKPQA